MEDTLFQMLSYFHRAPRESVLESTWSAFKNGPCEHYFCIWADFGTQIMQILGGTQIVPNPPSLYLTAIQIHGACVAFTVQTKSLVCCIRKGEPHENLLLL